MNHLDKIFNNKLKHHKTDPPDNLWDKIDTALEENNRKKKAFMYWKVAAAIVLILSAGVGIYQFNGQNGSTQLADTTQLDESFQNESKGLNSQRGPSPKQLEETVKDIDPPIVTRKVETTKGENLGQTQGLENINNESKLDIYANESPSEDAKNELILQLTQIDKVKPMNIDTSTFSSFELLASLENLSPVSLPITVIYKPGSAQNTVAADQNDTTNPLALLAELKSSGLGFTEIRSAKSALIAKVFSKIESETSR